MRTTGIYQNYKLIIEKIFNQYSDYVLKSKLLEKFNNYLLSEGFEKKSLKTLDRIIDTMIKEDYEFLFGFDGHERTLKLNFIPNKLILSKDEKNAFPLIFGNMQTEADLPTIKKIKELVAQEYPVPIEFVGVKNRFGESGQPEELLKKFGCSHADIIKAIKKVIARKIKR